VLTLSGSAIPLDYQVALRAVTFSAGPGAPAGTRTISFTVNDGLANGNTAPKQITVQSALVPGDFNFNGHLDADDIQAMLVALTNLSGFQSTHQLSNANLLTLADLNGDGFVRNSDIQRLLDMAAALGGGGGSSTTGVAAAVQTTNSSAAPSVTNTTTLSTVSADTLVVQKKVQPQSSIPMGPFAAVQTQSKSATALKTLGKSLDVDRPLTKPLTASAVDQALTASPMLRSRHWRWNANSSPAAVDDFFAAAP
jgi:hypothetical protein